MVSKAIQARNGRLSISVASHRERDAIYRLRHAVHASELRQHEEHADGTLLTSSLSPRLGPLAVRIAVKDAQANQHMVDILARVLEGPQHRGL